MNENRKRVAIFVDAANFEFSLQKINLEPDIEKIMRYIRMFFGDVVFAKYYTNRPNRKSRKRKAFLQKLRDAGFKLFLKKIAVTTINNIRKLKCNVDVEIGFDMARLPVDQFDTIIIFSGDRDFHYPLKILKNEGKEIIVFSIDDNVSPELKEVADTYISLESIIWKIARQ